MDVKNLKISLIGCVPIAFILLFMRNTSPEERVEFNRHKQNLFNRITWNFATNYTMSNKTIYELNWLRIYKI